MDDDGLVAEDQRLLQNDVELGVAQTEEQARPLLPPPPKKKVLEIRKEKEMETKFRPKAESIEK